jgi:hypothetical protein
MCNAGNQTIYRGCFVELKKAGAVTNAEMREVLRSHEGCMQLDKKKELVLN